MTSRQPGTSRAGSRSRVRNQGAGSAPDRLLVLPLTLLIILGLAGLHGAVAAPTWNGPLHRDGVAIGIALEVVLGVLLVITIRRRSADLKAEPGNTEPGNAAAVKLRGVLVFMLVAGMLAVVVGIIASQRLHLGAAKPPKSSGEPASKPGLPTPPPVPKSQHSSLLHIPPDAILYALLIVVLLAGLVLSIWWSRRFRPPGIPDRDGFIAEDPEDLLQAVESGRSALSTVDDARAAIIACYVAMEDSLAERGAARAAADTPDELLARATKSGVVRGTAAARLTALFYEARFSSHELGREQRDAAGQALNELAAGLADARAASGADA
jgi:Domain of unknown function (DUF4129)